MADTILTRMARAMCRFDGLHESMPSFEGKQMWESYSEQAKAVLSAMREPTGALLDAIQAAESTTHDVDATWKAAIDAALEEG